jgi:hypothetical protein
MSNHLNTWKRRERKAARLSGAERLSPEERPGQAAGPLLSGPLDEFALPPLDEFVLPPLDELVLPLAGTEACPRDAPSEVRTSWASPGGG